MTRGSTLPSMYRSGLFVRCVQVTHSRYQCNGLSWTWPLLHSVPDSQTTRWPHLPSRPSSALWLPGWRYMKAVHWQEAPSWTRWFIEEGEGKKNIWHWSLKITYCFKKSSYDTWRNKIFLFESDWDLHLSKLQRVTCLFSLIPSVSSV